MSDEQLSSVVAGRLAELRSDFAAGERDLARLDEQRETLRVALLRLSGAIQVLTELTEPPDATDAARPANEACRRTGPVTLVDVSSVGDPASSQ